MYKITTENGAIIEECNFGYQVCRILKDGLENKKWDMHRFHIEKYAVLHPNELIFNESAAWFLNKYVLKLQERIESMSESLQAFGTDIVQIQKVLLKNNLITQDELFFPVGDKS